MNETIFWTSSICLCLTVGYAFLSYLKRTNPQRNEKTQFSAFLIHKAKPQPSPTDFASFLKPSTQSPTPSQEFLAEEIPPGATPVPIFYGTEFGFSKEVAEKLAEAIGGTGTFWSDCPKGLDLASEQLLLFVCSTQGDGVPPYEARSFCEWLVEGHGIGDLSSTAFSVCALGDRSYAHFCRCGLRIQAALKEKGSQECVQSAEIDREDWTTINRWISDIWIPTAPLAESNGWTKSRPFGAKLIHRRNLCTVTDIRDKITVHLDLDITESGLSYLPGDAVGVYPTNRPSDVKALLTVLHVNPSMKVKVPSWRYRRSDWDTINEVSVEEALRMFYDLRSPKVKLFECLRDGVRLNEKSNGVMKSTSVHDSGQSIDRLDGQVSEHTRLKKLIEDADHRDFYLQSRHVIDILVDAGCPPLPLHKLLECLRPLQPRLYSISSSQKDTPNCISMTVAEVKYVAHEGDRVGVASTFLTERTNIGDTVWVYISVNPDFRLPKSITTPILMIGPGTGLAPFRSFVLEKLAIGGDDAVGINLLLFGCRRRDKDYLYGDALEDWHRRGMISLHTAFSRQQDRKIYVQDKLKEQKEAVLKLIEDGGHIYVCGDAQYMAPDVESCLLEILSSNADTSNGAKAKLEELEQIGRYQRDVWF